MANDSGCFRSSSYAVQDGLISEETKLRNDLAHIFSGTRHTGDDTMTLKDINEWSELNIVSAAVIICMVQGLQLPSTALDHAVKVITSAHTAATLDDLRRVDAQTRAGPPLLDNPLFYQLVMAAALKNNNRPLFRAMMSASTTFPSPPPGHQLLFSPERHPRLPLSAGQQATFGGKSSYGHAALRGQPDNGCDLWADMIEAGWALPRAYMQIWAATSSVPSAGLRLLNLLVSRGVVLDDATLYFAQMYGTPEVFSRLLDTKPLPSDPPARQSLLHLAAHHGDVDGVRELETLFAHGISAADVNWRPGPEVPVSMPRGREDKVPYRTALHTAAERGHAGVVEWLIKHGAEATYDYHHQEPLDLARAEGHENVVAVFGRYPECTAIKPWFWKSWF
ncbi:hypothetical protein F5X68DRAFT_193955 [Plectosphaerella plurivora]|uniref:Ankyrin n=1 Tax=Plectosphaerella plurivora TaxID=936078 RepID=A0A9P8V5F9_9PEZI|nr:hypothetical protein F5X68DRAFT_193955 [Plectosphaerella plurivora]